MRKLVGLFGICLLTNLSFSQKNYVVSYNKAADSYEIFEMKLVNGKTEKVSLKNKFPKLKENDVVNVEVTHYNPFKYYVSIDENWKTATTGKKSGASGILNLVTMGLNPFSSFLGSIPSPESFSTRGDESASQIQNELEFDIYKSESSKLISNVNAYLDHYKEFQAVLEILQEEDIESQKEMIIGKLEECEKAYFDPRFVIDELYPSAKYHFNKAGIVNSKVVMEENALDIRIKQFKEELSNVNSSYSKESIRTLIQQLETAKFTCEKKFQISSVQTFTIDDPESDELQQDDVAIAKLFNINFYNIGDVKMGKEDSYPPSFVRYFHPNRYWTPKGEITDTFCQGCKPVVSAEGLWKGDAPRNLYDVFVTYNSYNYFTLGENAYIPAERYTPLQDDAEGNWFFYDINGKLDHVSVAPSFPDKSENEWKNVQDMKIDPYELEGKVAQRKSLEFPIKGAMSVQWSSGIYLVGSFSNRLNYTPQFNVDSVKIVSSVAPNAKYCFGSLMDFQFYGNKSFAPSLNVGAAIDFSQNRDIQFLVGGGLTFKKFPLLGISAGFAFTPNNVLLDEYQTNVLYDVYNFDETAFQKRKYQMGYFVGINLNF
jgi:hypothetical protein